MTGTLAVIILLSTCFKEVLNMKKVWWGPIYSLFNECLWITMFLMVPGQRILLLACAFYMLTYGAAVPKWYREKNGRC